MTDDYLMEATHLKLSIRAAEDEVAQLTAQLRIIQKYDKGDRVQCSLLFCNQDKDSALHVNIPRCIGVEVLTQTLKLKEHVVAELKEQFKNM